MSKIVSVLAALALTLSAVIGAGGTATAATGTKTVCETGYRGQPAYDRYCLTRGTVGDGFRMWRSMPRGKKGHESRDLADRRSVCKYGPKIMGSLGVAVRELNYDIAYDRYVNHTAVLRYATAAAHVECAALGYRR